MPQPAPIPGHRIVPDVDRETLRVWFRVAAEGTEFSDDTVNGLTEIEAVLGLDPSGQLDRYLAYLDGEPVAAAALGLAVGVAALFAVATLPAVRRRSIGSALTLAPQRTASARGYHTGVLCATPDGLPVCQRPGFEEICAFHL